MRQFIAAMLATTACVTIAGTAHAQATAGVAPDTAPEAAASDNSGDIIVTAQKESRSLRESPVSVAVVTSESLARAGVSTLDDVGKTVPSVSALPSNQSLRPRFTIRGVSTDVLGIGAPSGVAVMVDGVTLAPESLGARQLADIQNVEILRGPQSTLGGRTASIGVINIVTRKPSDTFEGNASLTATTDSEFRGSAFIAGPISEGISFSLSGFAGKTDFATRNLSTGKRDRSSSQGVRGKLLFQPTEDIDITLAGSYVHTRDVGAFAAYIGTDPTALFRGSVPQALALPGITAALGNFDYKTITTPFQNVRDQLYSLTIDYRIGGGFTLSSITARQSEKRILVNDLYFQAADFVSRNTAAAFSYDNTHTFDLDIVGYSQEFKLASPDLGPVKFIAGLYYDQVESGYQFDRRSFGFNPLLFSANRTPNNKTYAAYARADWHLGDTTTLITGLRYNHDVIAYTYQLQTAQQAGPNLIQFTRKDSSSKNTLVGDVTLKQDVADRANVYATYSRGYKPEIYNLDGLVTATNVFVPVGREKVDNFELGFKGDLFDRLLTLNVAAFYTRYKNFQVQSLDFSNPLGATTFDVRNASEASSRGVEVDGTLRPGGGFTANFSAAWVKARFNSFPGAVCYSGQTAATGCVTVGGASSQDLSGVDLPRSPHFKFNIGLDQKIAVGADHELTLGAAFNYQGKTNFDPNHSPFAVQDAYGILNLSMGFAPVSGAYSLTLFVNNVTNKHYVANITDLTGRWGNRTALVGAYGRDAKRYAGIRLGAEF